MLSPHSPVRLSHDVADGSIFIRLAVVASQICAVFCVFSIGFRDIQLRM